MRTIEGIITAFIVPFILVGILALIFASAASLIMMDSSYYQMVFDAFDPRNHMWVRILYCVWGAASLFVGAVLGQLG